MNNYLHCTRGTGASGAWCVCVYGAPDVLCSSRQSEVPLAGADGVRAELWDEDPRGQAKERPLRLRLRDCDEGERARRVGYSGVATFVTVGVRGGVPMSRSSP